MSDYLKAVDGEPRNYIYAISMPAYYGGKGASGETGTGIIRWNRLISNMQTGIDNTKADWQINLPGGFCAYESGPDMAAGAG